MNRRLEVLKRWGARWGCLLTSAMALAGCASHGSYPTDWAPIAQDPALCAHVAGDYTPFDFPSRLIMSGIAGAPDPEPPAKAVAADRLRLRVADGSLTATAYLAGTIVAQRRYAIECRGDVVTLDLGTTFHGEQGVIGIESTKFTLQKDAAGAIVVQRQSSGVGAYGLFPIAGETSGWVGRFLPYRAGALIPQSPKRPPPPCEFNVSQIMVRTQQEADAIEQALAGGADFEQLAATHNRIFYMRWQKGRVGWIPSTLFPKWKPVIVSLKKGEYSRTPVKDDAGWHILRLNATRPEGCVATESP